MQTFSSALRLASNGAAIAVAVNFYEWDRTRREKNQRILQILTESQTHSYAWRIKKDVRVLRDGRRLESYPLNALYSKLPFARPVIDDYYQILSYLDSVNQSFVPLTTPFSSLSEMSDRDILIYATRALKKLLDMLDDPVALSRYAFSCEEASAITAANERYFLRLMRKMDEDLKTSREAANTSLNQLLATVQTADPQKFEASFDCAQKNLSSYLSAVNQFLGSQIAEDIETKLAINVMQISFIRAISAIIMLMDQTKVARECLRRSILADV